MSHLWIVLAEHQSPISAASWTYPIVGLFWSNRIKLSLINGKRASCRRDSAIDSDTWWSPLGRPSNPNSFFLQPRDLLYRAPWIRRSDNLSNWALGDFFSCLGGSLCVPCWSLVLLLLPFNDNWDSWWGSVSTVILETGTLYSILVALDETYLMSHSSCLPIFLDWYIHPYPPKLFFPFERSSETRTYSPDCIEVIVFVPDRLGTAVVSCEQSIISLWTDCSNSMHRFLFWNSVLEAISASNDFFFNVCAALWDTSVGSIILLFLGHPATCWSGSTLEFGISVDASFFSMVEKGFFLLMGCFHRDGHVTSV